MVCVFSALHDGMESGAFDPNTLSVVAIKGSNKGNRGIVSLYQLKKALNQHFHQVVLQKQPFSTSAKVNLSRVFASHASYRAMLKPLRPQDAQNLNLDWALNFTKADVAFRDFWEACRLRR